MRLRQKVVGAAGGWLLIAVATLSAARAAPPEMEEPHLDAKLGGITALLPVVDARPAGMAAIKVHASVIQDEVQRILRSSTVRVISKDDALKSMKGVGLDP